MLSKQNLARLTYRQDKTGSYSSVGAYFQEYALANLDSKGSIAYRSIGRLVTAINTGVMTLDLATAIYNGLKSGK